jgi:hypothetical protein
MFTTAEVRWFYPGEVPEEVAAWFADGAGPVEQQLPRVDEYLLIRETDTVNIKFREGRIEIKQRYGDVVQQEFADGSSGAIELWRKWGFGVDKKNSNGNLVETGDVWLAVRKDRRVRAYTLQVDGKIAPLPTSVFIEQGCSLELTEVDAGGERWWSLCFEAVGPTELLVEILIAVVDQVLANSGDFRLAAHASHGYSAWLQRFTDYLALT